MAEAEEQAEAEMKAKKRGFLAPKNQLKEFLHDDEDEGERATGENMFKTKPIADLFPETTVMVRPF